MVKKLGVPVLFFSSMAIGVASAAPCPDLVGTTWNFSLQCVRVDTTQSPPPAVFGSLSITGVIDQQQGCAFAGDLGGFGPSSWVGVLSGTGGRTVNFNFENPNGEPLPPPPNASNPSAVGTGEIAANEKTMTLTYTSGDLPPTACTGVGVKQ